MPNRICFKSLSDRSSGKNFFYRVSSVYRKGTVRLLADELVCRKDVLYSYSYVSMIEKDGSLVRDRTQYAFIVKTNIFDCTDMVLLSIERFTYNAVGTYVYLIHS
jgi:hypothetical protein